MIAYTVCTLENRRIESTTSRHSTTFAVMSTVTTANVTTARARATRGTTRDARCGRAVRAGVARAVTRASDDDDGGRRILGRGNARARGGSTARRVDRAALPHAFETSWWVEQAATCGVILAAYGAMATTRGGEDGDAEEECPRCDGTGRTACSCTRWSDDGEGCGACGYTGLTVCPACRGGGRAVRVTVKIEVPTETDEAEAFERDRSGARWIEDAPAFTSSMNPVVMDSTEPRGPRGGSGGDDDDPSSSKDDDFYAQSGEAIRVLREDYPSLLTKEPRWSIYREDIGLYDETMTFAGPGRDGRNGIMARNIGEYKRVFKIIRIIAAVLFSQSTMEVSRIWSPLGTSGLRTIRVRWSVRGKVRLVGSIGTDEARFDGISEYKLDSKGFIYEHKITDLDWDVAQLRERAVSMMRAAQGVRQPIGSGDW